MREPNSRCGELLIKRKNSPIVPFSVARILKSTLWNNGSQPPGEVLVLPSVPPGRHSVTLQRKKILHTSAGEKTEAQRGWVACSRLDGLLILEKVFAFKGFFLSPTACLYCSDCLRPVQKLYSQAGCLLESSQSRLWDWSLSHSSGLRDGHHFWGSCLFHVTVPPGSAEDCQLYTSDRSAPQWILHLVVFLAPVSRSCFGLHSSGYRLLWFSQYPNHCIICLVAFSFLTAGR